MNRSRETVPVTPRQAATVLRLSLAFVFILFGGIKLWPASPADDLVRDGVFFLPHEIFFPLLGLWEVIIGIGLLHPRTVRPAVYLLIPQIIGTQLPLFTVPHETWVQFPALPSEIGAYILKNWILLGTGLVALATVQNDTASSLSSAVSCYESVTRIDRYLSTWIDQYGYTTLKVMLAVAFIWFGGMTMAGFGSVSNLVVDALAIVAPSGVLVVLYGALKTSIGLTLLSKSTVRWSAVLAAVYILVSFVPLIVFPDTLFLVVPIAPSFEGVAILKDVILVSAVLWVAARTNTAD